MAKLNCGVYHILNKENGHSYIGSSINLCNRLASHKGKLNNNKHYNRYLQRAWNKYREDNFTFEILLYCDKDNTLLYERIVLDKLLPEYNIAKDVTAPTKGLVFGPRSEETKRKIGIGNKGYKHWLGKHHTKESRQKMSDSNKGENSHMLGKHLSEETKYKISKTSKGHIVSEETKQRISITLMGHGCSETTRKIIGETHKGNQYRLGKYHTEETKLKISISKSNPSEESRANMRSAQIGKSQSEETKIKKSNSMKLTWARKKELMQKQTA